MDMCEPTTACAENKAKAGVINDRLNSLSIETNDNLKRIREINGFLFPPEPLCEGENKKEAKTTGWFEYTIDMLITINNTNCKIKDELNRLIKELKG